MNSASTTPLCIGLLASAVTLLSTMTLPGYSWAQDASVTTSDQPANSRADKLEIIIVRGEKIERPYLETYSSVGVVTAEDFEQYDIADTTDAFRRLANVRSVPQAGGNSIQIRGLASDGVTQPANSAALISVVIDGVTQSAQALKRGSRGVWDTEQLEVHRGPQSTTQGRNALAGTVVIKTKDPTYEPEYSVRGVYGELDRREAAVALSGPIIEDQLAYRLAGEYAESERDIKLTDPDNKPFVEDEYHNVRGKLLYEPEQVEDLALLLTISDIFDAPSVAPVSGPDFFERIFDASTPFQEKREMDLINYSLDAGYALSEAMTLRSVTAYHDADLQIDSLPSDSGYFRDESRKDKDFSQEFRLEMNEGDLPLSGTFGAYYAEFDGETDTLIQFGDFVVQDGIIDRETESWAVYTDLRYRLVDSVSLIGGGRYLIDKVSRRGSSSGDRDVSENTEFDEFLPKLGIAWAFMEDQSLAFTATKGYRQGYVSSLTTVDLEVEEYDVEPEFVWTYEIAFRLVALEQRLRLGANLFYNDYTDQQVEVFNPDVSPSPFVLNAGDSEGYGAELEAHFYLGSGITTYAALGLLKTELGAIPSDDCPGGSCDGNAYPQAPELTASLGGSYEHQSGFFASLATDYTGDYFQNIENEPGIEVDDVFLVNALVGYRYSHYTVKLYANNLFDEDYLLSVLSETQAVIGDGRAIGLELQADF
ncbi:MAG: TonB-dependent receptor [Pseudomonadota bacterium]